MTNSKVYMSHSDGGHGWLAVKIVELVKLGIIENITSFSYIKGLTAYLEEDVDAGIFIRAFEKKYGYKPPMRDRYYNGRHYIRSYNNYHPEMARLIYSDLQRKHLNG